ncbi:MAG: hypothetical protein JRE64_07180 [Deltaproteobacteria bacterium]|nr:hypothetical protein [Deltaproteobacteria bacterium]
MDFRDPILIPMPKTDDEFERLCLLIARERYGPEFYRYARRGQKQNGIDIYSVYYHGRYLQCKLHKKDISDAKLIEELKEDLLKAIQKFDDLKQFIFAVSVETRPTVQDVCRELGDGKVKVIPWFWNQLQEDIARSKWLLRYCLNYEAGAQWISDDFVKNENKKGKEERWQPLQYYSSNMYVQWYGLLQNWDAPRQHYEGIRQAIANSFADTYSDMPVAAVVRGKGGSGKSVLLRRLAIDLRNEYTVYWVADNAADFLQNELLYDIDNHSIEKYLIVIEDWYRNFASTGDRALGNRLIQKIKKRPNVRLIIGDRPVQFTRYPKTDDIIFDLKSEENTALLPYIFDIVPEWKGKFLEKEKAKLLKGGLFQLLFVYQYADTGKPLPKAENYFLEIIQSDYKHLLNREHFFYKGLAYALYVYAHLYADIGFYLSLEVILDLAESYAKVQRPFELNHNIYKLVDDPIMKRYIDIVTLKSVFKEEITLLFFLHDTLADQGWKYIPVDASKVFGAASMAQLIDTLKTEKNADYLSALLFWVLGAKQAWLNKAQALACCDYLISIGCESFYYVQALFSKGLIEMNDSERLGYFQRLVGLGNRINSFWSQPVIWLRTQFNKQDCKDNLLNLIEAGNDTSAVLHEYFQLLCNTELKQIADRYFTIEKLKDSRFTSPLSVFLKRLGLDAKIRSIARNYLQSAELEKDSTTFIACLKLLQDDKIAKETARNYLQSSEPEKDSTTFIACLRVLGVEVMDIAISILESPINGQEQSFIYHALYIATKSEKLNSAAEDMVRRILQAKSERFNQAAQRHYYLYLQIMKLPLFRIKPWQSEVDTLLQDKCKIHRNLFYSLTLSHIERPEPLGPACLFYIRNWKQEFKQTKKYWGYFIRCLAHPIIVEQSDIKEEISELCSRMLQDPNCPSEIKGWLRSIADENKFPLWKIVEDISL